MPGVKRSRESRKGKKEKKGSIPSWDPDVPGESPLWVRQFSASGMLSRLKRHLKKQTNLEITFQKSREVLQTNPPTPQKKTQPVTTENAKNQTKSIIYRKRFQPHLAPRPEASKGRVVSELAQWHAGSRNWDF